MNIAWPHRIMHCMQNCQSATSDLLLDRQVVFHRRLPLLVEFGVGVSVGAGAGVGVGVGAGVGGPNSVPPVIHMTISMSSCHHTHVVLYRLDVHHWWKGASWVTHCTGWMCTIGGRVYHGSHIVQVGRRFRVQMQVA